jgi:hypothetical protein
MAEASDTQQLLALRKVTRAIADLLYGRMRDYLSALAPLMRPTGILGHYVQGGHKDASKDVLKNFQDLEGLYAGVATAKPFGLLPELRAPFEIVPFPLGLSPVEYHHTAKVSNQSKQVVITSPLKWVLTYSDFTPARLRQLLAEKTHSDADLSRFVLHSCVLHVVLAKQTMVTQMLDDLHFDLTTGRLPEFGELPITTIASTVPTSRPVDAVIIESTEISGRDAFEEVVDLQGVLGLRDPFKDRLVEIIRANGIKIGQ